MFGRKKNNFYRYMFQKSFMPLFAMLVVISMAFLIFFRITVVRENNGHYVVLEEKGAHAHK